MPNWSNLSIIEIAKSALPFIKNTLKINKRIPQKSIKIPEFFIKIIQPERPANI
jgi:hypothetical protein